MTNAQASTMEAGPEFDCIVIGAGPGGYEAAIRATQLGMKTAVVEANKLGGRCLHEACIPAKTVLRVADVLSEVRGAGEFGIKIGEIAVDFAAIQEWREQVIGKMASGVRGLLQNNKIEVIMGHGALTADGNVSVEGKELTAKAIILATGSVKKPLPNTSFGGRVIGTDGAWALEELPGSIAVVGAGASGVEIASAYARLGSEVSLYEYADRVLPTEDADISKLAERGFEQQKIKVNTNVRVENIKSADDKVTFTVAGEPREADYLVIAAGRTPDIEGLGLDKAEIKLNEANLIVVDEAMRTSRDGIYAIGDLVPGPALAHKASHEGHIAVENAAGMDTHAIAHQDIPRSTFCYPNIASFGLTEQQAKADPDIDVVVGKVKFGAVGAGTVYGDRSGLVKLIGDRKYGELIGGHIIGPRATDLIQELVLARFAEIGYKEIAKTIHGHPTFSEVVLEAARHTDGWLIHG